jgi:hypothetical protein
MKTPRSILQTGQISCHNARGERVACAGSGQDAELSKGLPWPEPRFFTRGEIVIHELTGLIWSRDANLAEYLDKGAISVGQKTQARFHVWAVQDCTHLE